MDHHYMYTPTGPLHARGRAAIGLNEMKIKSAHILYSLVQAHPYSTLILGVFPLHQIAHVGVSKCLGLKLFDREIIFEEF